MGEAANSNIGDNRNKERTTGTCETDILNNVYDLYGNSYEWTLEANGTTTRVYRGGNYKYNSLPSNHDYYLPTVKTDYNGSRLALYIK